MDRVSLLRVKRKEMEAGLKETLRPEYASIVQYSYNTTLHCINCIHRLLNTLYCKMSSLTLFFPGGALFVVCMLTKASVHFIQSMEAWSREVH